MRPKNPPPAQHSPTAEKAMLGACLLMGLGADAARDTLVKTLAVSDFYVPAHQVIAEAVIALHRVSSAVDETIVATWIVAHHGQDGLARVGGVGGLIEYMADCPSTGNAPVYAATILDRSIRRDLKTVMTGQLEQVDDLAADVDDVREVTIEKLNRVMTLGGIAGNLTPSPNFQDWLDMELTDDWLIPDLLERGSRIIITAAEGTGKSVICRQLGVQFAAGIHPWRRERFEPVRCLIVDLENSHRQIKRWLHVLAANVSGDRQAVIGAEPPPVFDPDRLHIEARPTGINLLDRDVRRWFTGLVQVNEPDVILTGPLYKLHFGDVNDDQNARILTSYLDQLRSEYGCAIILEAHSPHTSDGGRHRTLRPKGSQIWMAWPDAGYGIRQEENGYDFVSWRGARDETTTWPTRIRRGKRWPWVNEYARDDLEESF